MARKKWESGPRCPQTLVLPRFRWPGFKNKSGPKVKKSGPKSFFVRTNLNVTQIKVGQTHFQISISGPKRKGHVALYSKFFLSQGNVLSLSSIITYEYFPSRTTVYSLPKVNPFLSLANILLIHVTLLFIHYHSLLQISLFFIAY